MTNSTSADYRPTDPHPSDRYITREDAESLVDQCADFAERLYAPGDRYRVCEPGELRRKHRYAARFVEETQRQLEAAGFRFLADVQDMIASREARWLAKPAIIRGMVSSDGVQAGIYVVRMARLGTLFSLFRVVPRTIKALDLESDLSDGRFIATSNLLGLNLVSPVPEIIQRQLDPKTPVPEMLAEHHALVEQTLSQAPQGVRVVPIETLEDALASQERLMETKRRHKEQAGYITADDIRRANYGKRDKLTCLAMEEADRRNRAPRP